MENQSRQETGAKKGLAIITGASRGIGNAIAQQFADEGYSLILCSRNESNLLEAAEALRVRFPQVQISIFPAELSDKKSVIAFAEFCLQEGVPDILVNNAGTYLPGNAWNEPDGHMEQIMGINFYSAYYLTRLLLPAMTDRGSGHIFNICSIAALQAYEGGGSYSISKFALNGFSQNLRHELRKTGIKVTAVFPGAVMTDTWGGFDNSSQRIMEAEDVAIMVRAASRLSKQAVVEEIVLRPQLGDL